MLRSSTVALAWLPILPAASSVPEASSLVAQEPTSDSDRAKTLRELLMLREPGPYVYLAPSEDVDEAQWVEVSLIASLNRALDDELRSAVDAFTGITDWEFASIDDETLLLADSSRQLDGLTAWLGELFGHTEAAPPVGWSVDGLQIAVRGPLDELVPRLADRFLLHRLDSTPWERSADQGRQRARELVAALGGAEAWSGLARVVQVAQLEVENRGMRVELENRYVRGFDPPLTEIHQTQGGVTRLQVSTPSATHTEAGGVRSELPRGEAARLWRTETCTFAHVVRALAREGPLGCTLRDDGALVLFDDAGTLVVVTLDAEGLPATIGSHAGEDERLVTIDAGEVVGGRWWPVAYTMQGPVDLVVRVLSTEVTEERVDVAEDESRAEQEG